jgi:hypothetical protein
MLSCVAVEANRRTISPLLGNRHHHTLPIADLGVVVQLRTREQALLACGPHCNYSTTVAVQRKTMFSADDVRRRKSPGDKGEGEA